jgi:hypothetical protein
VLSPVGVGGTRCLLWELAEHACSACDSARVPRLALRDTECKVCLAIQSASHDTKCKLCLACSEKTLESLVCGHSRAG